MKPRPNRSSRRSFPFVSILLIPILVAACGDAWPPPLQRVGGHSPPLPPEEALETFFLPPGYRIELVASEPLVKAPVAIDFDADGRMWVVEMRGYMRDVDGRGQDEPIGRIVVLEDMDGDGRMDRSTVYMDHLVLPRAIKVLDGAVLVGAPPYLWLTRDTTGDLTADVIEVIRDDYGNPESNPEFNANGLLWGMDNWIHNTHYAGLLRYEQGELVFEPGINVGQWGITMDDYGRIYRNYNYQPLHVDLVPSIYFSRNPNLTRTSGLYERVARTRTVWPVRPTPGVNQGYLEGVLREDQTLIVYTSASGPVVYRGDRLPEEFRNNVFVPEPAANLVQRLVITEDEDGVLIGRNPYEAEGADFLASTDERFRPVNLYTAPDGTLYVVDMYRGIIQHKHHLSNYLRDYIIESGLNDPGDHGRIYRIVHETTVLDERPRLSGATAAELVAYLDHPNGWWRDTAQRLLVERGDRSAAPALRELVRSAERDVVRMHAMWTLDGLRAMDDETLLHALADPAPHARAAAVRIAERWLDDPSHPVARALPELLDDADPPVRRQLAASFGSLPPAERIQWLADAVVAHGHDPIVADVALGGLHGHEVAFLERLVAHEGLAESDAGDELVALTVAAIIKGNDPADVHRLFDRLASAAVPMRKRAALLRGVEASLEGVYLLRVDRRPDALVAAAEEEDSELAVRLRQALAQVVWPGKPGAVEQADAEPLTPEETERFETGRELYSFMCAPCHHPNGIGQPNLGTRLIGSEWVIGPQENLARVLLHGLQGESLMPRLGAALSDGEIAAVMTYIRREWGHLASPVSPEQVGAERDRAGDRDRPWTEDELRALLP